MKFLFSIFKAFVMVMNGSQLYEVLQILDRENNRYVDNNTLSRLITAALPRRSTRNIKHVKHVNSTKTRRVIKAVTLLLSLQDLKIFYVRNTYGHVMPELKQLHKAGALHALELQLIAYISDTVGAERISGTVVSNDEILATAVSNEMRKAMNDTHRDVPWITVSLYRGIQWALHKNISLQSKPIRKIGYPNHLISEPMAGLLDALRPDYLSEVLKWSTTNNSVSMLLNNLKMPPVYRS